MPRRPSWRLGSCAVPWLLGSPAWTGDHLTPRPICEGGSMATHPAKLPNVLAIVADDLGWFEVEAYHRGVMGSKTPNIDSIARDGALLTDAYAQASCTAGRAAFITGQLPMRTGLTAVGLPGAPQGLQKEDPTL